MTLNSDQVNYLIWRYLSESGFDHTAFTLKNEMFNAEQLDSIWASKVPTGHLINCLQRALMFEECVAHIDEQGKERDLASFTPSSLIPREHSTSPVITNGTPDLVVSTINSSMASRGPDLDLVNSEGKGRPTAPQEASNGATVDHIMTEAPAQAPSKLVVSQGTRCLVLEGHAAGLDQCLWHPVQPNIAATSSVDGTACIWTLPQGDDSEPSRVTLLCTPSRTTDKSVTSIAWNNNGSSLATGSYDGVSRIWSIYGMKQHRDLTFHTGPIFALKWSRRSEYLLTGAADGMVGVWNASTGSLQQKWDLKSPVMDLEWISDALFLSACKDGSLRMWQLGRDSQVKQFLGHSQDISMLKWNSNINLGATSSEDALVKVWRADSETPTQILRHHKAQIHAIEWAPKDQEDYRLLASASRDGQVCIWDVVRGELLHVLQHDRPIFALHFSRFNMLATAGEQGDIVVWDSATGKRAAIHSGREAGMAYNLKFSTDGQRILVAGAKLGMVISLPPR